MSIGRIVRVGRQAGLSAEHAAEVAAAYGVGRPTGQMVPAARGELGRIWRLPTAGGDLAVKDLFHPPTEAEAMADVAFQLLAREHGVVLPEPVVRTDGHVLTVLDGGPTVRAYAWVDLVPISTRPIDAVGDVLATLHRIAAPTDDSPSSWFTDPVGEPAWRELAARAESAGSPFASALLAALPHLIELDATLPVRPRDDARRCHLDLDDSNLAYDRQGRLVVLDWENSGPAAPVHELAMIAAEYGLDEGPQLVHAYHAAGGSAMIIDVEDFAMAVAVQGHLIAFYAGRWLAGLDADDVERSRWRLETALGPGLLTMHRLELLADALRAA